MMMVTMRSRSMRKEVVNYVIKNAQKDGVGKFEPEEITFIVQGELEYCDSINMFD